MIYINTNTNKKLNILNTTKYIPTFNTNPHKIINIITNKQHTITITIKNTKDHKKLTKKNLKNINLTSKNIIIKITTNNKTPYIINNLTFTNTINTTTISISYNKHTIINKITQYPIKIKINPKILTNSTHLKSNTTQKLILNIISTITIINIKKIYNNLIINIKTTNQKLINHSIHIIQKIYTITYNKTITLYQISKHNIKITTIINIYNISKKKTTKQLLNNNNIIKQTIKNKQP